MGNNRYTQLSFSNLRDVGLPQLPYQELDTLLAGTQQKIDTLQSASEFVPDFIRESADDRSIAGQIVQYQQNVKDQLANIASKGNTSEYLQALSQATNQIAKLYKPGGPADILKQRKLQDEAEKKRLYEFYKDNPTWADYAVKTRKYNEVGYNPATGEFNPVNTFGNTPKFISGKEFDEWANRNIDNIKETLINQGVSKKDLDRVQSIYDFYDIKGVTYDRLMSALTNALPPEYIQSMYHQANVNKFYDPTQPDLDTEMFIKNEKGEVVPNIKNPVAKKLHGYATGAARVDIEHDRVQYKDILGIAEYESSLRKKEIDYENQLQFQTMFGRLSGNSSGMPEWNLNVGDNGKLVTTGKMSTGLAPSFAPAGVSIPQYVETEQHVGESFKSALQSGKLETMQPGVMSVYNEFKSHIDKLSDKDAAEFVKQKYTELRQHMNTTDIQFEIPTNKKAVEQAEALGKIIIGTKGAIGTVGNSTVFVYDQAGGIQGKPMSLESILSTYDIKPEEFTEQAKYFGAVVSSNPKQPSGNFIQLTTKDGKVVNLLATPESEQVNAVKTPSFILSSPQFHSKETSPVTLTGTAIDQAFPAGIFSKRKNIRQSDVLASKIELEQRLIMSGKKDQSDLDTLTQRYVKLLQNPSEDALLETQIELYDAANPSKKIGDQTDYNLILTTLEQKARELQQ